MASVTYPYESSPGYLALVAQFGVTCYFGSTMAATISNEAHIPRKNFLGRFMLVGLFWFVVVPVTVLIATLLDPYLRAKSVAIMRLLVDASVLTGLVWLVAPARQDQFFTQASVPSVFNLHDGSSAYDNL
eukprot:CAMPEP_0179412088 /NCGR_PEP_ID=MMETSP0799-20121207/4265_1 /TAXON_ID=46947 /ORGANISM="Geminigera cryophila, Strain CCMP2564" /LENGTH=129 /DNA_ID=CAMNT_0021184243 /DNA_START=344 /DNA_END=733 /DNA_ORIENTATION=+